MNPTVGLTAAPTQTSGGNFGNGSIDPNSPFALRNEFMTLMVAQIQNQDPLNPLDGTEYVTQLAQFSQVESLELIRLGQQQTAVLTENLQVLGTTNLLGREVVVEADSVTLADEAIEGKVAIGHAVEAMTLEVTDEHGDVVATINLGSQKAGDIDFTLDPEALGLAPGEYSLAAKYEADGEAGDGVVLLAVEVQKVHISSASGYMMLELAHGLGTVPVFDIREIA